MATRTYNENSHDMATAPHGHYPPSHDMATAPPGHYPPAHDMARAPAGHYRPDLDPNNPPSPSTGGNSHDPSDNTEQSRYLDNLSRGRAAKFFVNGDVFFPAKKLVYNPRHFRDFTHYLDYLTDKLEPRFGAVRKICTPHHGHRIRELRDLQENGVYVVAGKERFKPYQYEQIPSHDQRRQQPLNPGADPVYQSRQYVTSGRIKKCETHSILIKVWPNGGDLKGPRRVLLTPRVRPFTLPNVVASVNEILKQDLLGTVERLYFLTGVQVSEVDQITHNGQYVACKKTEKFKRTSYNEQGVKNLSTSPRLQRKLLAPLFPRSTNSLNQSSPDQSNESTQSSVTSNSHRTRALLGDERVHHVRPLKHSSSDRTYASDLEKEQGGIPKAHRAARPGQDNLGQPGLKEDPSQRNGYPPGQPEVRAYNNRRVQPPPDRRSNSHAPQPPDRTLNGYGGHKTNKEHRSTKAPEISRQNRRPNSSERLIEVDNAATKIQAAFRGHQTRKDFNSPKPPAVVRKERRYSQDELVEVDNAATKIQAAYRGHQARKELRSSKSPSGTKQHKKHPSGDRPDEVDKAAAKIQAAYRGHQTRKKIGSMKPQSSPDESKKNNAATKIQASYRGYQERRSRGIKSNGHQEEAAKKIQAGYRGYQTRKQLQQKTKEKEKAAAKIQAGLRGYQARNRLSNEKAAATKIQSSYRGHMTRKKLDLSQDNPHHDRSEEEHKAAAKIQAGYRGYVTRKQVPRQPHADSPDGTARQNDAALRIQSHYRGHLTRQELARRQADEQSDKYY